MLLQSLEVKLKIIFKSCFSVKYLSDFFRLCKIGGNQRETIFGKHQFFFLRPSSSPFRDHVNNEPLSLSSGTPSELLFADQFNTDIAKVKQSIEGVGPTKKKKGSKNKVRPRIPRFIYNSLRPVKRRGYPFFPTILLLRKDRSHLCTCEPVIIICACASE